MSRKKHKPKPPKKRSGPQYSIARALRSFSGEDEAALCAFLEEMERGRLAGDCLQGWRVTRDLKGWKLECLTVLGEHMSGEGETCTLACKAMGQQLVSEAMKGAPTA